jgi:hypothetical protein
VLDTEDENIKTGALFAVAEHYLADLRNNCDLAEKLDPELANRLLTTELLVKPKVGIAVRPQ